MRRKATFALFTLAVLTAAVVLAGNAVQAGGKDFKSLFNGKDLTGWKVKLFSKGDPEKTFQVKDGMVVVSGSPNGYFYTDKSYKNYVFKYDWRYKKPADLTDDSKFKGNSGLLVHIQEHGKSWPKSIEVQGMNKDHGQIFAIGGIKEANVKAKFYADKLKETRKPVGEWNTTEFTCDNGKLTTKVNGEVVAEGTCNPELSGPIGLQSEGAEIHFKNMQIKVLK